MTQRAEELAAAFNHLRARSVNVAYAIVGSHAEAEDVVAECWLRLAEADARDRVRDIEAWTTVAVARAALDVVRSARKRREVYVGPWLPEPRLGLVPVAAAGSADPVDRVMLDDTVRYALLIALEALTPAERTAWVLHDLFGMGFTQVGATVDRTPAAVRQLAARARGHLRRSAPRFSVSVAEHDAAVRRFLEAAAGGDLAPLLQALDPDVVATSDGGGQVSAALRPIVGAAKVQRFLMGLLTHRRVPGEYLAPITVNGELGVGSFTADQITTAMAFTFDGPRIVRIDIVRSPDKLRLD